MFLATVVAARVAVREEEQELLCLLKKVENRQKRRSSDRLPGFHCRFVYRIGKLSAVTFSEIV